MHPFPSISQFRNVIAHVRRQATFVGLDEVGEAIYNPAAKSPTLSYVGTVKLHGTNAAVVFSPEGTSFQSRERVLTAEQDNAGFYAHMTHHSHVLDSLYAQIAVSAGLDMLVAHTVAVYGEWCGGNIQKGVAITGLPKMFVIFAIKINGQWLADLPFGIANTAASIYSIDQFQKWFVNIDFEQPEKAQNLMAEITEGVEACCPVGKHFGVEGIGEGVVWRCIDDLTSGLWFKVKGEKHSASKVKTLASVDVEAVENLRTFVEKTVTEARLEQGLQNLVNEQRKPFEMTSMGDFIRWVYGDIVKEEYDTIQASNLDVKKIGGPVAQAARRWYITRLNQKVGLPA